MHNQSFLDDVKTAMQVAFFKQADMHHVASDKSKTKSALLIIVVAALLSFLGQQFFSSWVKPALTTGLLMSLFQVIMMVVGIYVMSFVAQKIFKGSGAHDAFFRVLGFAVIVSWISLIPMLGLISALWSLALVFVILKAVHKLTTGGAIGTIIVSIVIMGLIGMVTAPLFGGYGMGSIGKFRGETYKFNTPYGGATMDVEDEDTFEMSVPTEEGTGNVKMEDRKMTITSPDGEVMEITIPSYE
ncbi:YIP1 family protein [Patescibacteria group bacterium]|nr:YIP1 family protein [Patescibacteria group bacterium]